MLMVRVTGIVGLAAVLCSAGMAQAQTPLERGTYLMSSIVACGNCHTQNTPQGPRPGMELAGGTKFDEAFGVAYAPNITPDPETGIGIGGPISVPFGRLPSRIARISCSSLHFPSPVSGSGVMLDA